MISFIVPTHNEQSCLGRTLRVIDDPVRIEKIRRQKRKRSRRAKQRMLESKSHQGAKKASRRFVGDE